MHHETDTFSIRVILICVLVLYSVLSCMIVSVTANVYGCTLDETPGNSPEAAL